MGGSHCSPWLLLLVCLALLARSEVRSDAGARPQAPLSHHATTTDRNVSAALFSELEELARIVDISYCVGLTSAGISKPFSCPSRCTEFPEFELVTTWNTGPLLSDSCGYIALDHGKRRIIVAFRGTYSITNTIVDLSTIPQEYVPYPGSDDDDDNSKSSSFVSPKIISGLKLNGKREHDSRPKCSNCTVHMGFHSSWLNTRKAILLDLQDQIALNPDYSLSLVGHSLGGAVATLAGLDFLARGWEPTVTTFGGPRVGNAGLVQYIDNLFQIGANNSIPVNDTSIHFRRVTHVDDPVPLLPLSEWGYAMHAGEIYISKSALSPDIPDLQHCQGDNDPECIAGQDPTTPPQGPSVQKRDLISSVKDEIYDVTHEPWGIPSRYKLWELLFAHRDYFYRIGLCVTPMGGGDLWGSPKHDL